LQDKRKDSAKRRNNGLMNGKVNASINNPGHEKDPRDNACRFSWRARRGFINEPLVVQNATIKKNYASRTRLNHWRADYEQQAGAMTG
jgi:hypothetical protein